jgi:hypothetical protein
MLRATIDEGENVRQRLNIPRSLSIILFFSLLVWTSSCRKAGPAEAKIDRKLENGVEVIQNHLGPYPVRSEPTDFKLEEELTIDFAGPEIGEMGLANTTDFIVDTKGFIYFMHVWKEGDTIFKFGPDGRFLKSWGRKGQGPGELQFIIGACFTDSGQLVVSDHTNLKLIWFTDEGKLIKEVRYPPDGRYDIIFPVSEDRFVGYARVWTEPESDSFEYTFYLLDGTLKELKKLDTYRYPNPAKKGRRGVNINEFFVVKSSPSRLFIGNEDRGYEILELDHDGNPLKKIRKEYAPVRVPEEIITKRKAASGRRGGGYYFPDYYLPICDFFADDDNRLFVMTFEKGAHPGEFWYDIFDPNGVFITRKPLHILTWGEIVACGQATRNRLYCFQEREDGYRLFKVYKMLWQ